MKNVLKPLAKSILILLGLTAGPSATPIHKKMFGSGMTRLIISNEEMNDIMKIVKSLGVSEIIKNEAKNKKAHFSVRSWYIRCYFIKKFVNRHN